MFCAYCGKSMDDNATVCPNCGRQVIKSASKTSQSQPLRYGQPQYPYGYVQPQVPVVPYVQPQQAQPQQEQVPQAKVKDPLKRTNAVGIVGFLFSFFAFLFSAGIFSFPGFLVSCVGVGVRKQYNKGNGTAIAGLVFAILGLLIFGFILYLIITGQFSDLLARFDIYLD